MAIQKWDPLSDLVKLQTRMNDLFEETLARSTTSDGVTRLSTGWAPPLDLHETADGYVLRADIPGVAPGDVKLQVEDGQLSIRGERKMDGSVSRDAYLRVERPYGPFAVQITLPASVDSEKIEASHKSGVIEIVLPKRARESNDPIRIAVK